MHWFKLSVDKSFIAYIKWGFEKNIFVQLIPLLNPFFITRTDLNGLTGENWVNDNIIEVYMQMVAERSCTKTWRNLGRPKVYCMSTYFFISLIKRGHGAMQRWTKDVDIFSYDIILIPIHQEDHWCLATVDFRSPGNRTS